MINTASADHAGAVQALIAGLEGSAKPLLHTSGSSVIGDDARGSRRSEQVFDDGDAAGRDSRSSRLAASIDLRVLGAAGAASARR